MNSFIVKGVCIGEGRPKTIVSLMGTCEEELVEAAREAVAAGAECLEWRADYARDARDPAEMARIARVLGDQLPHTPLVFTFRSAGQGGQLELGRDAYKELLRAVMASGGVDLVDVELCMGDNAVCALVQEAHDLDLRALVSHHDFAGTPRVKQMRDTLVRMSVLGADLPKLAVMAHDVLDCLRLMEATVRASEMLKQPLVTMAMGGDGTLSRLAGETVGSALTFCALGTPSAPGQVGLDAATRVLDELHNVCTSTPNSDAVDGGND